MNKLVNTSRPSKFLFIYKYLTVSIFCCFYLNTNISQICSRCSSIHTKCERYFIRYLKTCLRNIKNANIIGHFNFDANSNVNVSIRYLFLQKWAYLLLIVILKQSPTKKCIHIFKRSLVIIIQANSTIIKRVVWPFLITDTVATTDRNMLKKTFCDGHKEHFFNFILNTV